MKKVVWIAITVGVLLLLLYIGGSYYFSSVLIDLETQTLAESEASMAELALPELDLPAPETVSIQAGDVTLAGFYYDNPTDGDCAVLLLHGYTGTRYGTKQYMPLFWERGCDLLAYDARGHGESSDAYHTYGYHEKQDGQAAYEWLLDRTGLEPAQVGVTGVSYGAATAVQMLPLIPNVAFVLADSPYQDLKTIVSHQAVEQFGSWVNLFVPGAFVISEQRADFDADEVSPQNAIAGATAPVLLIHSKTDGFTPYTNSEEIYANGNPDTTVLVINEWGSEHARDIITDYEGYKAIVDEFLAEYVPEFGASDGR